MSARQESPTEPLIAPDLVLLLLQAETDAPAARNEIHGITRLEKLLFLAEQEEGISKEVEDAFVFKAYDYGPYSKEIYEAVELLEEAGLLREERVFEGRSLDEMEEAFATISEPEGVERRFFLTDEGVAVAQLLAKEHPKVSSGLSSIKNRYASMSLRSLIRYVYGRYPSFAEASKIRDEVL